MQNSLTTTIQHQLSQHSSLLSSCGWLNGIRSASTF